MSTKFEAVTNLRDARVEGGADGAPWAGQYQVLTPHMRQAGGRLGMVMNRLPAGSVGCPFHWHTHEDEVFYVVSGRGVLRYGDEELREIGPGDCISCPAGSKRAHQIANPYDENLLYLAAGNYDAHEVCGYPDTGKILVRDLGTIGRMEATEYMDGEPEPPRIFGMHEGSTTKRKC
jgi:uncharacterized cupin superfamily protein